MKNNPFLNNVDYQHKKINSIPLKKKDTSLKIDSFTNAIHSKPIIATIEYPLIEPIKKTTSILQPEMRFKPRTDLERIFDTLSSSPSFGNINHKILDKHLSKLNLNKCLIENEEDDEVDDQTEHKETDFYEQYCKNLLFEQENKKKLFNTTDTKGNCQLSLTTQNNKSPSSLVTQKRNMKSFISKSKRNPQRNLKINEEAKELMSDLHVKTHFKAAAEIASNGTYNFILYL